jgi:SAM-dependent methyltransferase
MSRRDPRVHPRVRGFDRAAEAYERGRPGYPPAAARYLARVLGLRRGQTVVELGSGTGKLTRNLLGSGAAIVAVEPTSGMRRVFARRLPSTLLLDGTAEAIPLPDGVADAVVVAQAFQWFRPGPALREVDRVLRPGGVLALVWNVRRPHGRLARRVNAVVDRLEEEARRKRGPRWAAPGRRRWRAAFQDGRFGFGRPRRRSFFHRQAVTPRALVDRVLSESAVATLGAGQRRRVASEVRTVLAQETRGLRGRGLAAGLPYRTDVYLVRRVRRRAAGFRRRRRRTTATRRTPGTSRG